MVAISLYRGNLHKVPDVPRRWIIPTPKISLKNFKTLLHRRSKALSRLHDPNPNPSPHSKQDEQTKQEEDNLNGHDTQIHELGPTLKTEELEEGGGLDEEEEEEEEEGEVKRDDKKGVDGEDCEGKTLDDESQPLVEDKRDNEEGRGNSEEEKTEAPVNPSSETNKKEDALSDKDKRKREVEEKLQILNTKKHNLVQMLKQILNAEEELKRRSSMQGMVVRPSLPLQVDVTNDSGSMTRHATPKMGSEGNLVGDVEGGEADDTSNHNMHSRNFLRMNSISPSSDSPYRRPAYNGVPHPSRATFPVAGSPSRFAPTGQQVHPANLPTVSVSGTNYIASSPSPAASGGTSAFRDSRLPSPWN